MSGDSDEQRVMSMLGCTEEEAERYLEAANGDVLKAITDNLNVPEVSGSKFIPAEPPKIDDGLTPEVREKILKAREIAEQFSASFRNDLRGAQPNQQSVVQERSEEPPAELEVPELEPSQ